MTKVRNVSLQSNDTRGIDISKHVIFSMIGKFTENKGVSFIIDVFKKLDNEKALLLIVGDVFGASVSMRELQGQAKHDSRIIFWGVETNIIAHAMDWYPTLASLAGIKVPEGIILDGRDLTDVLKGKSDEVEISLQGGPLNASIPLRRYWNPVYDWRDRISREDYLNAFFYHGSTGALAAVRFGKWKLHLNPQPRLYDLDEDPGETTPVRNREYTSMLRGLAVMFQEEMNFFTVPAGVEMEESFGGKMISAK